MPEDLDQSFGKRLRTLREDLGLSRSRLSRASVGYKGQPEGVSEETIKALENDKWGPLPETMGAIAHGLGLDPAAAFPEYQLALARRLFDEREVGLAAALANLSRLDASLELAAEAAVADATGPAGRRTRRSPPARRGAEEKGPGPS